MSDRVETERGCLALAGGRPVVLAAFDSLEPSDHRAAQTWAAEEATARHAVLRVVNLSSAAPPGPMVDAAADRAGGSDEVDARLADLLIVGTADAAEAVVAADELETAAGVLASLPRSGRRRLACPVIVLRGARRRQPIRRIVVGVISSEVAAAALHWAIDEAAIHHADLVLVHAWQRAAGAQQSTWRDSLDRTDARRVVDRAVLECVARSDGEVRGDIYEGDAGPVLVAASQDADLLVVGSRAQSGFTTMLFGPATTFVVGAAGCPVALIDPQVGPA